MVFVLNRNKNPLNMCTEAKARYLLDHGNAVVHKMYPFTIRLKTKVEEPFLKNYRIKIDPGSRNTGVAIVDEDNNVCFLAELEHRINISKMLEKRSDARRNRRTRELRHRRCKFGNQRVKKKVKGNFASSRPEGWLPPSIKSVLDNTINFVKKLQKLCKITSLSMENVKFDIQLLENPDMQGVEYQQGTLWGYETKEYLLYKFGHVCQYCKTKGTSEKTVNASKDNVLEIEHMHSQKNNGSNRIKNLTIACRTCNQDKGGRNLDEWHNDLKKSKSKLNKIRVDNIEKILKDGIKPVSYKFTAKINSMRKSLYRELRLMEFDFESETGARTKMNRIAQELPKEHYYDALCVGDVSEEGFKFKTNKVLKIKACGRGNRFRGKTNACGIIIHKYFPRKKMHFGFQTGDIVRADVTIGIKAGVHIGRVAVRSTGSFNITTSNGKVQGIHHRFCTLIQRNDGYSYHLEDRNFDKIEKVS